MNGSEKTGDVVDNTYIIRAISENVRAVAKFKESDGDGLDAAGKQHPDIYPNPAKDCIFITGRTGNDVVTIYNAIGRKVLESGEDRLNISSLDRGIYFVKTAGRVTKIVKE